MSQEAILNIVYQENSGLLSYDEVLQKEEDPIYRFRVENKDNFDKFPGLMEIDK